MTRIEHANMTVPDIDEAISFIQLVAPDFKIRKDQRPPHSYRWVHIGNEKCYFALQEAHLDAEPELPRRAYKNFGVNHLALVVEKIDAIANKLIQAGYRRGIETPAEKNRKRLYFLDKNNFEWELIEYISSRLDEKFLYE